MKHGQRVARVEVVQVPAATGPQVGDLVWLYSREYGRSTENLARVTASRGDVLDVEHKDQGVVVEHRNVKPWGADSVVGWSKAK